MITEGNKVEGKGEGPLDPHLRFTAQNCVMKLEGRKTTGWMIKVSNPRYFSSPDDPYQFWGSLCFCSVGTRVLS